MIKVKNSKFIAEYHLANVFFIYCVCLTHVLSVYFAKPIPKPDCANDTIGLTVKEKIPFQCITLAQTFSEQAKFRRILPDKIYKALRASTLGADYQYLLSEICAQAMPNWHINKC